MMRGEVRGYWQWEVCVHTANTEHTTTGLLLELTLSNLHHPPTHSTQMCK